MNSIQALLQTDFGNPDGLYDKNLENYFLCKLPLIRTA